ncbi:hypothetical protein SPRG_07007 [Saprolegnia parasitica CBS 223.65]|uniref:Uncharacterized protein n=1 Tax=Saprolegnia parasitica (strain CBS 223.65) TaxID=695850 RepID=A0A067C9G9_SAPPC|nr:hypothetical protein SPRG_07007 [Saprolegnia parasitica CBS 223.65]KDO27419.1 hypothetical protein SPRG_07007 [Saprolegnia parasitica CBS 223.65]|eukprot:XP_012201859.1 hypothetical protein SPRG_07007 [Saprolegnia parasitica CBS 223.65]
MPSKKRRGFRRKGSDGEGSSSEKGVLSPTASGRPKLLMGRPALGIRALASSAMDPANLFGFGDVYLSDLSSLRQFELINLQPFPVRVGLNAELRKPFHASTWGFQTHNENLPDDDGVVESPLVRSMSKSSFSSSLADTVFLDEGFNELFNQMGLIDSIVLEPNQAQRLIFSICVKHEASGTAAKPSTGLTSKANAGDDSSDEERLYLNESSFAALSGRLIFSTTILSPDRSPTSPVGALDAITIPIQGNVCRSLLRLDVKELHFDDCIPGGSYVKDFTVWNRSEIPLVFRMMSSIPDDQKAMLTCSDYNSGYAMGENPFQVAAYGHMRVRVTYRPVEVGEHSFEILVQNLHDSRNVKTLKVHAIASKEHHREGLSIREPNGSFLMSGSLMDFGDCYTGMPTPKIVLIKNMTEAPLHIELSSDRPKEVTFELKLVGNNRARSSRSMSTMRGLGFDEPLSPTDSRLSLSPTATSPTNSAFFKTENGDSDDEPDENDGDDEDLTFSRKRNSFEDTLLSEMEDADDDMEFDGERLAPPPSPSSPKTHDEGHAPNKVPLRARSSRKLLRVHSRVKDLTESGIESSGASVCSSPERKSTSLVRTKSGVRPALDDHVNNYLVEALDLAPGVERTIVVWYTPTPSEVFDVKSCRLTKQSFRLSFRCYQVQGAWTGSNQRVYDRSLGKSLHARSRTCTSYVTMTPSVLHFGDCNIGELRSSACTLTNHSELPTVVKPSVVSKVVSTVPNDEMTLGPKQSLEMKIEIIPRKVNANYTRVINAVNLKNKLNLAQVCVRSSNMDAHHVIYHSLFYKLHTPSKSAFLNFEHVAANSMSIKVFTLENITSAVLRLRVQSSDPSRVQLYYIADHAKTAVALSLVSPAVSPLAAPIESPLVSPAPVAVTTASAASLHMPPTQTIRRRRSIGSIKELNAPKKTTELSRLQELLSKKKKTTTAKRNGSGTSTATLTMPTTPLAASATQTPTSSMPSVPTVVERSNGNGAKKELDAVTSDVVGMFESLRFDAEREKDTVTLIRERVRRFHQLVADKHLVPVLTTKEWNVRIPAKGSLPILAVFTPKVGEETPEKSRVEKYKVFVTLPAGGNQQGRHPDLSASASLGHSLHPFDTRPSVRELLLKSRVCRSVLQVNQKNINFGRITTFSKSSKKVLVRNGSAIPLVYMIEKTGSISSGFLEIKDGDVGVIKPFGARHVCFEFQPTLAGPFEEKLKIVNVQDVENSVFVTIKAKVVKRETFKLPQAGQPISVGTCLVDEPSDAFKLTIRNMSRKKREYVIEVDTATGFSVPSLRPTFTFNLDAVPAANITQAQEKKLDEELEKLEHKLRIAVTKKKEDKIGKLNSKISHVKALLSGEGSAETGKHPPRSSASAYDSGNSDTESESESRTPLRRQIVRRRSVPTVVHNTLHFTLEPESTGRIVGTVVFKQEGDVVSAKKAGPHRRRHHGRRGKNMLPPTSVPGAATPIFGVGKFLFYEQQNKDVMKELQYKADVYLRTPAGENAYCRVVGKTLLPPMPFRDPVPTKPAIDRFQVSVGQLGATRPSTLLLPIEEAPSDALGWLLEVRAKEASTLELKWVPTDAFQDVVGLAVAMADDVPMVLPQKLAIAPDTTSTLHVRWHFAAKSGIEATAPLATTLGKLALPSEWKKTGEIPAGRLVLSDGKSTSSIDVMLVKTQLGAIVHGVFYVCNASATPVKFLVLVSSTGPDDAPPKATNLVLPTATGRVDGNGRTPIRFTYTGTTSGKHTEVILVRNLNDRLDSTNVTINVRVTRPVYVRIPELDPHLTGQLTDLNIGPCYVTADEIDGKFSKVRKITLVSQVTETLLLCASSNLKTQCYVYEDAALQHDATNIILPGMEATDLYIAFRPRLPADAFKTGASRDLMGGIRMQLFREKDALEDRELAAEFTVNLATVVPREIDFGTELNIGRLQRCKTHEGCFELTNVNKSLPLTYRVYVASVHEAGYSDDDESLHVSLRHEKGEIPPGESCRIDFNVAAFTHGLFRRRIVVENVYNPQNVNTVDVVLFVDNGSIACDVVPRAALYTLQDRLRAMLQGDLLATKGSVLTLGTVPVISSEPLGLVANGDNQRQYRIFQPSTVADHRSYVSLVNRSSRSVTLRPISNLPLLFTWLAVEAQAAMHSVPTFANGIMAADARELSAVPSSSATVAGLYTGPVCTLEPHTIVVVATQFAPVACSGLLPIDAIDAGKTVPLQGMIAFQSFEDHHEQCEATTLGVLPVTGVYGESRLQLLSSHISLGKIGYSTAWSPCTFEVDVKNMADIPGLFCLGPLPSCLVLLEIRRAARVPSPKNSHQDEDGGASGVHSLQEQLATALSGAVSDVFYEIDGRATATLVFECLHTPEYLSAGRHELSVSLFNFHNPHNTQVVTVSAHVIANYMDIALESDCTRHDEALVAYVPPLVLPSDAPSGFLCTIHNVFDDDLEIKLSCHAADALASVLDVAVVSRSSNTPLTALTLPPGEHVDVRVHCSMLPGATWTDLPFASSGDGSRFDDACDLGMLSIAATALDSAARIREIAIKGALVLGQSFSLSARQLRFHANPLPRSSCYQLQQSSDCFWIQNPSTTQPLTFEVTSFSTHVPGLCFLHKETSAAAMGDVLCAVVTPATGTIAPKSSMKVLVHLEECTHAGHEAHSEPNVMRLSVRDVTASSASLIDVLLVMEEAEMAALPPAVIQSAVSKRRPRLDTTSSDPSTLLEDHVTVEAAVVESDAASSPPPSEVVEAATDALLTVRGCTPAENSTLDNTLYVIDVGQHTVRAGGEVEWEITLHNEQEKSVGYRLYLADAKASSWLRLSKSHGSLLSYQTIVLRFARDVVGVYSTFLVLENVGNPSDLKLIRVKMEVIADLNALRAMAKDKSDTNLFRVLVSNYSGSKRQRRKSSEFSLTPEDPPSRLEIEYGDVFYDKLYHNHSVLLENFSSLSLDFMLSSNGRPHEVGFSMSPTSFNEISSVTLGAYQRLQVFLNFRPAPKKATATSESWVRNIEVYVNCRLVKDFRETVFLKATCNMPQLHVHIAHAQPTLGDWPTYHEPALPYFAAQPTFLGMGFSAPESILCEDSPTDMQADAKFIVLRNVRHDVNAHVAIRNDSMFFEVKVDHIVDVDGVLAPLALRVDGDQKHATLSLKLEPHDIAVLRIEPNLELLRKHRQQWEHSVKEHIAFYNMKQFAEHYHVSLSFTPSNMSSFLNAPQLREAYPFSTLEDTIAKFLKTFQLFWKDLHTVLLDSDLDDDNRRSLLYELEHAIDLVVPVSPRPHGRLGQATIPQSYRALYFDFYYITDELIWYGVRSNAGRHTVTLADLVYGVVFGHEVFTCIFEAASGPSPLLPLLQKHRLEKFMDVRRLLLPWTRQLGYFLSFFPENQETTLPLRQLYEPLKRSDLQR